MQNGLSKIVRKRFSKFLSYFLGIYLLFVAIGVHASLAEQEHRHDSGSADTECFCVFHSPTLIAPAPHFDFSDIFVEKVIEFLSFRDVDLGFSPPVYRLSPRAPPST